MAMKTLARRGHERSCLDGLGHGAMRVGPDALDCYFFPPSLIQTGPARNQL
jgi:hypothetical protein